MVDYNLIESTFRRLSASGAERAVTVADFFLNIFNSPNIGSKVETNKQTKNKKTDDSLITKLAGKSSSVMQSDVSDIQINFGGFGIDQFCGGSEVRN